MRSRLRPAALAAAALLSVSACTAGGGAEETDGPPVSGVTVHDDDGLHGAVLPDPYVVPRIALTDTEGRRTTLAQATDAPLTLVFFGYTQCPDVCQLVMADLTNALLRLDEAERAQVAMTFVTTDPARDDAGTLRAYLDRFDPTFVGLTAPLPRVVALGDAVGVPVAKGERLPSGGYEVDHGANVLGLAGDGTVPVVWTQGTPPEQIAEDIRAVLAAGGVPGTGAAS